MQLRTWQITPSKTWRNKALETQFCAPGRVRDDSGHPTILPKPTQQASKFPDTANIYAFSVLWGSRGGLQIDFSKFSANFACIRITFGVVVTKNVMHCSLIFGLHSILNFTMSVVFEVLADLQIIPHTSTKCLQRTRLPDVKFRGFQSPFGLGGIREAQTISDFRETMEPEFQRHR